MLYLSLIFCNASNKFALSAVLTYLNSIFSLKAIRCCSVNALPAFKQLAIFALISLPSLMSCDHNTLNNALLLIQFCIVSGEIST
ncbi:hypothetical protein CWC18_19610 [Pseudoalteromonas aurantia]|nr:hypothetical protein CWC18_19610 [Pseudoalteromonas aurantia]